MTNSRKELSFSGHTHSGYALTNHTHSNYAPTNHTHSNYALTSHTHSQYMTEVDINQMIEDVIDSYVPTIQTMGQVGNTGVLYDDMSKTITIPSSANVFLFVITDSKMAGSVSYVSIRGGSRWLMPRGIGVGISSTATSITFSYSGSGNMTIYYVYF